ncbi:tRNA (Guanine-1)-methyltransferase [Actinomadura madurae]|uniref:tRNA (guanine-N(1)-)-methyltransferase n=1 Tax=Actinomadura madurae TaxID=1993 RepID=A0A1I4W3J0_9ACTN|nr:tRNA (Guanine-1)-methyltransferase [Actinomadura madurae]
MKIDIVTIFPEYFAPLEISLLGKARRAGILDVHVHDLRAWTHDRHRTVDDTPYGGGPGMVMKPTPWGEALDALVPPPGEPSAGPRPEEAPHGTLPSDRPQDGGASSDPTDAGGLPAGSRSEGTSLSGVSSDRSHAGGPPSGDAAQGASASGDGRSLGDPSSRMPAGDVPSPASPAGSGPRLIIPTPSGRPFTQADAVRYAAEPWLVFACGRYEGIDSRVAEEARTRMPVDEVSLGDFVLAGGEVAVLVMVEAIGRLLPGVLGNADSAADDSFAPGAMESLLEGPVYTKPPVWRDRAVPDVLLSGHHGAIARWRRDEALRRTARHRPELLDRLDREALDERDRAVLREAGFPVDGEDMAD